MTITYEYEGALYVNLTNKCNCNCEFCLRHGEKEAPSIRRTPCGWSGSPPARRLWTASSAGTSPATVKSSSAAMANPLTVWTIFSGW